MKISVLGCGRWGSFIAWYLDKVGHQVCLYAREGSRHMEELNRARRDGVSPLPESIRFITDLNRATTAKYIVISVGSQNLRELTRQIGKERAQDKTFILCMKGLEIGTGMRLSEIVRAELGDRVSVAVWLGPGHVQEFRRGIPNCMVIDSDDEQVKAELVHAFSSDLIRFYYGTDLVGNEIGAAAKNVIGIAAGMLDGLELSSLKGALMSRGTGEIARLIRAMGGKELSAYGLCHLGDYEATVFSQYSHNRRYGEMLVRGEQFKELAEGYFTVRAIVDLGNRYGIALPICEAVEQVLYHGAQPSETLNTLFERSLKNEF